MTTGPEAGLGGSGGREEASAPLFAHELWMPPRGHPASPGGDAHTFRGAVSSVGVL